MKTNLILSYPRSGSTFVRYIIEHFTERPTRGPLNSKNGIDESLISDYKDKKPIAYRLHGQDEHSIDEVQGFLNRKCPLIFLMRSPIEVFPRHTSLEKVSKLLNEEVEYCSELPEEISYFFNNIKIYESYKEKKQIFYYEDLVDDPGEFIRQMCEFLQVDSDGIKKKDFMNNFKTHFEKSRSFYNDRQASIVTAMFTFSLDPPAREYTEIYIQKLMSILSDPDADWRQKKANPDTFLPNKKFLIWEPGNEGKIPHLHMGAGLIHRDYANNEFISQLEEDLNMSRDLPGPPMFQPIPMGIDEEGRYLRFIHGKGAVEESYTLMIRIPTQNIISGTRTDGQQVETHSSSFKIKQKENFWNNIKKLCGEESWPTFEKYVKIEGDFYETR